MFKIYPFLKFGWSEMNKKIPFIHMATDERLFLHLKPNNWYANQWTLPTFIIEMVEKNNNQFFKIIVHFKTYG